MVKNLCKLAKTSPPLTSILPLGDKKRFLLCQNSCLVCVNELCFIF